jgi:hypothetical protein
LEREGGEEETAKAQSPKIQWKKIKYIYTSHRRYF